MFKKRDIELIILDVLGCLDEQDRESLRFLKVNDETFCWKELGEAQNLSALFASIEKFDIPSFEAKEIVVRKLNRMIFGKEDVDEPQKFVPVKRKTEKENVEENAFISLKIPANLKNIEFFSGGDKKDFNSLG